MQLILVFYTNKISKNKKLFGSNIDNNNINSMIYQIIYDYISQGINCLFENNLLNEKDKDFIFGCLTLLLYTSTNTYSLNKITIIKL